MRTITFLIGRAARAASARGSVSVVLAPATNVQVARWAARGSGVIAVTHARPSPPRLASFIEPSRGPAESPWEPSRACASDASLAASDASEPSHESWVDPPSFGPPSGDGGVVPAEPPAGPPPAAPPAPLPALPPAPVASPPSPEEQATIKQ